jgi:serine/threonine protein kinase
MDDKMIFFNSKKYHGKKYGKYTILQSVGEGRYGMCFLAHSIDGTPVILKRFKPSIFKKNNEKNPNEAIILSQLKHNSIPELLGVVNVKGFYGFVLEYKPGNTIKELLFKNKYKFTKEEFFNIGLQLIRIIKYIHERGFVHRDIRIPNVLIDIDVVYLIDFGLARYVDNDKYSYSLDFSYLGDFLLYLLYSSFESKEKQKKLPWYKELTLTIKQEVFIKKLLGLETPYRNIDDIEKDFILAFQVKSTTTQ